MQLLPLYDAAPLGAVEGAAPLSLDKDCRRCALSTRTPAVRTVCVGADGDPGGVLLVGEAPGRQEDLIGRPFVGQSGSLLRAIVAKHWAGPVAYDNAVRCYPGAADPTDKAIAACRGYLRQTLAEVKPQRIITLGSVAAQSVLGRGVQTINLRRAYAHLADGTPVFTVLHPAAALRNRFVRSWFEQDLGWALTASVPARAPLAGVVRMVMSEADALAAEAEFLLAEWFAFDVETRGTMWEPTFRILCASLCAAGVDSPWCWGSAALATPRTRAVLLRLMANPDARKAGQNVKYDMLAFRAAYDTPVRGVMLDTRLQRKLIEPDASGKLVDMSELVGMGGYKQENDRAKAVELKAVRSRLQRDAREAKKRNLSLFAPDPIHPRAAPDLDEYIRRHTDEPEHWVYALLPERTLVQYNARDAVATARLGVQLGRELAQVPELDFVWHDLAKPASAALERMEAWGIPVDREAILAFDSYLAIHEGDAKIRLDAHAKDINWKSADQVAALLFEKMGIPPVLLTKDGQPSTDDSVLEALAGKYSVARELRAYRKVVKMRGTYAVGDDGGLLRHVRSDGRIHPNVKLDGARSGRTSCTQPNLQNIPTAKTAEGKMARQCFAALPGWFFLELDYNQIELRVAALLSGDAKMKAIFANNQDYHLRTAQMVAELAWGMRAEDIDPEGLQRKAAKTINFGLLYGQGDTALAAKIGCSAAQAARIREAILGNFTRLDTWIDERLLYARKYGHSWTWWKGKRARRRNLWRIADKDDAAVSNAENGSFNTPIQGTAADFCIASLIQLVNYVEEDGVPAEVVVPVHDSIMLHVRRDYVREVAYTAKAIMEGHESGDVRLVVDTKVGSTWGTLEKYDEKKWAA